MVMHALVMHACTLSLGGRGRGITLSLRSVLRPYLTHSKTQRRLYHRLYSKIRHSTLVPYRHTLSKEPLAQGKGVGGDRKRVESLAQIGGSL